MTAQWEILETVGTEEVAAVIAGFLRSRGLECQLESLLFHQEPVTFGRLGEVRIRVLLADLEKAKELLEEQRFGDGLGGDLPEELLGDDSDPAPSTA